MRKIHQTIVAGLAAGMLALFANAAPAAAQTTLEKVKAQGFVQCGSTVRPGLAMVDGKNRWSGLEVEVCRAIAIAVFGANARYAYHEYNSDKDYATAPDDQVSFVDFTEMLDHKLTDTLLPGPTVFIETHDILVAKASPIAHLADLAGNSVCFMTGAPADSSLAAYFDERKLPLVRFGFQEDGEMYDTYDVQQCKSVVGESTALASARLDGGVNRLVSRFLPEHLAAFPIVAATPLKDDAQWAAIVAWTVQTLVVANGHPTDYHPGGLLTMPVHGAGLGLADDWQKQVVASVGSYSAVFKRTLGAGSPLKLEPGLNAPLTEGGIFLPPVLDH